MSSSSCSPAITPTLPAGGTKCRQAVTSSDLFAQWVPQDKQDKKILAEILAEEQED
ncbi:MAG: hypothetical protein ACLUB2_00645 [Butyricicoccus pullicaecorum]